jgi:hypothetical protein
MLTETQAGSVLKIAGATHLAIYDLEIYGAFGPSNAGILLQTGNAATVDLVRATVRGGTGVGILADGGTLNISQTTIVDNGGGGISLTGSSFRIVNNIIARNGNFSSSQIGGVSVQGFASGSRLDFNTIVANYSTFEQTSAGGVRCDRPGFTSTGNLIFRNVGGPQANVQTVGACQHSNSYINPGTSLADNEPMFVNPNVLPFDYHLTENSPANIIDAGGKCPSGDFDIDGDARPSGAECDVGADELIRR